MATYEWPAKGASDVLDYSIDWSAALDGDTISTSTFTVQSGLTKGSTSNSTTRSTVWLSGGTAGVSYTVNCVITTAASRTLSRDVLIRVVTSP